MILAQTGYEIYSSEAVGCGIFYRFCDVISGMVDQNVGIYVCANCGDSRLKPSEASFSVLFRKSITSEVHSNVVSYPA